jgi:hypothetical protein
MSSLYDQISGSPETLFWLNAVARAAVPSIALVGAVYTAWQYRRAQRWRAGDLAAQVVGRLSTDDKLLFACQALDWGTGPLIVPARYRPLMSSKPRDPAHPTPRELGEVMDHETTLMYRALRVRLSFDLERQPGGLVYRYCFDELFAHLANVHRLLVDGQLKAKDLVDLKYWIGKIADYRFGPIDERGGKMFQPFVGHEPFGYQGVRKLGKTLGVGGWLPKPPVRADRTPPPVQVPTTDPIRTLTRPPPPADN